MTDLRPNLQGRVNAAGGSAGEAEDFESNDCKSEDSAAEKELLSKRRRAASGTRANASSGVRKIPSVKQQATRAQPGKREGESGKRFLSKYEIAAYLSLSRYTIDAWVSQRREIPFIKMGRRVLFDISDIEAWIERQKVKPE